MTTTMAMNELLLTYNYPHVLEKIFSNLSINEKSTARAVCKVWKVAAESELGKVKVVFTDDPATAQGVDYMMRLLPFMEQEEWSLYRRNRGNQIYLPARIKSFPEPALHFIDKFCRKIEGLVCNLNISLVWLLQKRSTLKFVNCHSCDDSPSQKLFDFLYLMEHGKRLASGDESALKKGSKGPEGGLQLPRRYGSARGIYQRMPKFKCLQSLNYNTLNGDYLGLEKSFSTKACYPILTPDGYSRFVEERHFGEPGISSLPSDLKYLGWRVSERLPLAKLNSNGPPVPLSIPSLIHLDVTLSNGLCSFDFANLRRITITINNNSTHAGPGAIKISKGFVQSLVHSKNLNYVHLQVLYMEPDHLKMMAELVNRLDQLTDLYIVNLDENGLRWNNETLDHLVESILTCPKLKRLQLEFLGLNEQHMSRLARLNNLKRLVVARFTPQLVTSFILNLTADRTSLVVQESTSSYHRMTDELHTAIQNVLKSRVVECLTCHVKCNCKESNCPLKALGLRGEWRIKPYQLTIL